MGKQPAKHSAKHPAKQSTFSAKKKILLAVAVLLFSAVVSIIMTANDGENRAAQFVRGAFIPRGEVQNGTLEWDDIDPITEVPDGEIRYLINQEPVYGNGYSLGDLTLQNPEQSPYALQFKVYPVNGGTNVPVYTSPMLLPGQYILQDKLNRYLRHGTHECTYSVAAYDPTDLSVEIGTSSGFLTITVLN